MLRITGKPQSFSRPWAHWAHNPHPEVQAGGLEKPLLENSPLPWVEGSRHWPSFSVVFLVLAAYGKAGPASQLVGAHSVLSVDI